MSLMKGHGMEDTDIQATFDSVNGNAYVILSNENKNGGKHSGRRHIQELLTLSVAKGVANSLEQSSLGFT